MAASQPVEEIRNALFGELSKHDQETLDAFLDLTQPPVCLSRVTFGPETLKNFRPREWFNDDIIDTYMDILCARAALAFGVRCFPIKSFLGKTAQKPELSKEDIRAVLKFFSAKMFGPLRGDTPKTAQWIMMPISRDAIHWVLGAYNRDTRILHCFDSLRAATDVAEVPEFGLQLKRALEVYFANKEGGVPDITVHNNSADVQKDGYNCGPYVLATAELLCAGVPIRDIGTALQNSRHDKLSIDNYRKHVAVTIATSEALMRPKTCLYVDPAGAICRRDVASTNSAIPYCPEHLYLLSEKPPNKAAKPSAFSTAAAIDLRSDDESDDGGGGSGWGAAASAAAGAGAGAGGGGSGSGAAAGAGGGAGAALGSGWGAAASASAGSKKRPRDKDEKPLQVDVDLTEEDPVKKPSKKPSKKPFKKPSSDGELSPVASDWMRHFDPGDWENAANLGAVRAVYTKFARNP